MATVLWGRDIAEVYDTTYAAKFAPAVVDPVVDVLAGLAGDGAALELAIGTGRVALPLARRGVRVHGIELSPDMVEQLRRKPGADAITVDGRRHGLDAGAGHVRRSCTSCSTRS